MPFGAAFLAGLFERVLRAIVDVGVVVVVVVCAGSAGESRACGSDATVGVISFDELSSVREGAELRARVCQPAEG